VGIKRIILEDHRDVSIFWRDVIHDFAVDGNRPFGYLFQASNHTQGRGLAATRRPDQNQKLFVRDNDVGVFNGIKLFATGSSKNLGQILQNHVCHDGRSF
jgi:hypothetical protein